MRLSRSLIASLAFALVVGVSCGSDEPDADSVAPSAESEVMVGDIVEVAIAADQFPTLIAAVQAAGLVETLQGDGPFTVFAPSEAAFSAALAALNLTAAELLADTETLTSILTYHVLPGTVMSADLVGASDVAVATVNGAEIVVNEYMGAVTINSATVVAADIAASNGVIHVIDQVLLP